LEADVRSKIYCKWSEGLLQVVVATIAFGLGIDKPGRVLRILTQAHRWTQSEIEVIQLYGPLFTYLFTLKLGIAEYKKR